MMPGFANGTPIAQRERRLRLHAAAADLDFAAPALHQIAAGVRRIREIPANADVAQLVEHFTRNEGVPGSSPGVGSGDSASRTFRGQRGGQQRVPTAGARGHRPRSVGRPKIELREIVFEIGQGEDSRLRDLAGSSDYRDLVVGVFKPPLRLGKGGVAVRLRAEAECALSVTRMATAASEPSLWGAIFGSGSPPRRPDDRRSWHRPAGASEMGVAPAFHLDTALLHRRAQ